MKGREVGAMIRMIDECKADELRCRALVPDFTGFHWFQCSNKRKYGDLCGVHERVRLRHEQRQKPRRKAVSDDNPNT